MSDRWKSNARSYPPEDLLAQPRPSGESQFLVPNMASSVDGLNGVIQDHSLVDSEIIITGARYTVYLSLL
jgi:hypothetical protein